MAVVQVRRRELGYNPNAAGPDDEFEVAWEYDVEALNETAEPIAVSSPIVLADWVLVAFEYLVDLETVVVALERETGDVDWVERFTYDPEPRSRVPPSRTLETGDGALYLATRDEDGRLLRRLEPTTDEETWNQPIDGGLSAPPTFADGSLYAEVEGLVAVDAADGTVERRFDTAPVRARAGTTTYPPTVDDDNVYVAREDTLQAWDRADGTHRWSVDSPFDSITGGTTRFYAPVAAGGVVYAAAGDLEAGDVGGCITVSSDDGQVRWETQPDGTTEPPDRDDEQPGDQLAGLYGLPIVREEDGVGCAFGRQRGEWGLFGFDLEDGAIRWFEHVGSIGLVAAADRVFLHGASGVGAVDPSDGTVLGGDALEIERAQPNTQVPAVAGERLYVATVERVGAFGP